MGILSAFQPIWLMMLFLGLGMVLVIIYVMHKFQDQDRKLKYIMETIVESHKHIHPLNVPHDSHGGGAAAAATTHFPFAGKLHAYDGQLCLLPNWLAEQSPVTDVTDQLIEVSDDEDENEEDSESSSSEYDESDNEDDDAQSELTDLQDEEEEEPMVIHVTKIAEMDGDITEVPLEPESFPLSSTRMVLDDRELSLVEETPDSDTNKPNYKTMPLPELRALAMQTGKVEDASKLKRVELIRLLK